MQDAVKKLQNLGEQLTDELDDKQLAHATAAVDLLRQPISAEEIRALLLLLPPNGDTAAGLNWTILHTLEASPLWPLWNMLQHDQHEWVRIARTRLANAGEYPPS